ncbi:MAG TPA: hypothetical protein VHZ29_03955 [Rhizomicrobium sp.]|jgi:hypothetical protein|nr:hypothetical protein [Rhizomicrobium sp.]
MRVFLAIALALGLSACSDWNGSFFGSDDAHEAQPASAADAAPAPAMSAAPAQMTEARPAETPPPPPSDVHPSDPKGHCALLARQRAGDAAYAGEDETTQQSVYDKTYAGCMDWDARHAS